LNELLGQAVECGSFAAVARQTALF